MVQYLPWSVDTLQACIKATKEGMMPALDLELTAKCSRACCIYCDSMPNVCANPDIKELSLETTQNMLKQAASRGLKWIYTCGLGEPFEDKRFPAILEFLKENGIFLSMFTNGQFIESVDMAKRLKECNVNLILKMDTFDGDKFDTILGGKGRAQKIYKAIDFLLESGYANVGSDGYTDFAFSIVPTQLTIETIPEVVDFCIKNNIFPSIGELELAGNVVNHNLVGRLGLNEVDLKKIRYKSQLEQMNYMRPICPAILTGLHIDNQGNCIVDAVTGLNCKWFLLSNPNTKVIGNVMDLSVLDLQKKVALYRETCLKENIDTINQYETINYVFGGCGGNPSEIIRLYKENFSINE